MKIFKLSILAVLLIAITSCNNANKKMMELIPENSTLVFSLNPAKVSEHTGIKVDDNGHVELPGTLKELAEANTKELDSIATEIAKMGVDPSVNIYGFTNIQDIKEPSFFILATIKDTEAAKALIEKESHKKFKNVGDIEIFEEGNAGVAIKDNIVLIGADQSQNITDVAKKIFAKEGKSILENSEACKTLDADCDINYYVNYASYMKLMAQMNPKISLVSSFLNGFRGLGANIDLSDNEINCTSEVFADDDSDIMKLLNDIKGDASADFLKHMPGKSKLILSASIKGEKLADFAQVKNLLEMGGGYVQADLVSLVKSINGPIALGIDGELNNKENFAIAVVITTSKAAEWKKMIETLLQSKGGAPMPLTIDATAGELVIKVGNNSSFATNATNNEDANKIFNDNFSGLWMGFPVNGMTMRIDAGANDMKNGNLKFFISKDNKNMIFGDYPKFFMALQEMFRPQPSEMYYDDSDIEVVDSVAVE